MYLHPTAAVINRTVIVSDENEGPVVNIAAVRSSNPPFLPFDQPFLSLERFPAFRASLSAILTDTGYESANMLFYQWLGMTLTVLFIFIRLGSKWSVLQKWNSDDTTIVATMVRSHLIPDNCQTHVDCRSSQLYTQLRYH